MTGVEVLDSLCQEIGGLELPHHHELGLIKKMNKMRMELYPATINWVVLSPTDYEWYRCLIRHFRKEIPDHPMFRDAFVISDSERPDNEPLFV